MIPQSKSLDEKTKQYVLTGEEIAINEYIDEKQVYRKRINCGALPNAGGKFVSCDLTDVTYVKIEGLAYADKSVIPLPYTAVYQNSDGTKNISIEIDNNRIYIYTGIDRSIFTSSYIDVYYTKNQ